MHSHVFHIANNRHHWELFPNMCHLSEVIVDDLKSMMLQARCGELISYSPTRHVAFIWYKCRIDRLTSDVSATPYDADLLTRLYSIIEQLPGILHEI